MNLLTVALIVGAFLPNAVAALTQSRWPAWAKANLALILALTAALVTVVVRDGWHGWNHALLIAFLTAAGPLVIANFTAYDNYWRHSPITAWIDKVTTFAVRNPDVVAKVLRLLEGASPESRAAVVAELTKPPAA